VEKRARLPRGNNGSAPETGGQAVRSMQIHVADAIRQAGEPFPFELCESVPTQSYAGREIVFREPVRVCGSYAYDGKAFTVRAEVGTVLLSVCARCGKPFAEPVAFSIFERFVKDTGADPDDETYPYEGEELLLDKAVFDNLYLQLPIASVCREDCRGLCPVCGADRNVIDCGCVQNETTEAANPFSVLGASSEQK